MFGEVVYSYFGGEIKIFKNGKISKRPLKTSDNRMHSSDSTVSSVAFYTSNTNYFIPYSFDKRIFDNIWTNIDHQTVVVHHPSVVISHKLE